MNFKARGHTRDLAHVFRKNVVYLSRNCPILFKTSKTDILIFCRKLTTTSRKSTFLYNDPVDKVCFKIKLTFY